MTKCGLTPSRRKCSQFPAECSKRDFSMTKTDFARVWFPFLSLCYLCFHWNCGRELESTLEVLQYTSNMRTLQVFSLLEKTLLSWTEPEGFPLLNMSARETDLQPPIQWCDLAGYTDSSALLHSWHCSINSRPKNKFCDQPQLKTHTENVGVVLLTLLSCTDLNFFWVRHVF